MATYTASYPIRYGAAPSAYREAYQMSGAVPSAYREAYQMSGHSSNGHDKRHKMLYRHLRMHPNAYIAAQSFGKRLAAGDPAAKAALHDLLAKCQAKDPRACNAARCIAVVMKCEHMIPADHADHADHESIAAGALPNAAGLAAKFVKLVLSPAGWALGVAGRGAHWAGNTLTNLGHAL